MPEPTINEIFKRDMPAYYEAYCKTVDTQNTGVTKPFPYELFDKLFHGFAAQYGKKSYVFIEEKANLHTFVLVVVSTIINLNSRVCNSAESPGQAKGFRLDVPIRATIRACLRQDHPVTGAKVLPVENDEILTVGGYPANISNN